MTETLVAEVERLRDEAVNVMRRRLSPYLSPAAAELLRLRSA